MFTWLAFPSCTFRSRGVCVRCAVQDKKGVCSWCGAFEFLRCLSGFDSWWARSVIRSRLSPLVVSWQIASGRETEDVVPWREMKMMMMRKKGNPSIPSSSGRERSSTATGHDGKKGSIGPPPTYDGSREPGVFEEYRIRARLLYMGGFLKWGYPQIIKNYRWSFHEINHPFCVPPFSETPILFLG